MYNFIKITPFLITFPCIAAHMEFGSGKLNGSYYEWSYELTASTGGIKCANAGGKNGCTLEFWYYINGGKHKIGVPNPGVITTDRSESLDYHLSIHGSRSGILRIPKSIYKPDGLVKLRWYELKSGDWYASANHFEYYLPRPEEACELD